MTNEGYACRRGEKALINTDQGTGAGGITPISPGGHRASILEVRPLTFL